MNLSILVASLRHFIRDTGSSRPPRCQSNDEQLYNYPVARHSPSSQPGQAQIWCHILVVSTSKPCAETAAPLAQQVVVEKLAAVVAVVAQQRDGQRRLHRARGLEHARRALIPHWPALGPLGGDVRDRKSTRLNSSHANISYAVF